MGKVIPFVSKWQEVEVKEYSGHRYGERPKSLIINGMELEINQIIDRWYDQTYDCFKVEVSRIGLVLLKLKRDDLIWFMRRLYP